MSHLLSADGNGNRILRIVRRETTEEETEQADIETERVIRVVAPSDVQFQLSSQEEGGQEEVVINTNGVPAEALCIDTAAFVGKIKKDSAILFVGNIMLGTYFVWGIICWGNIMLGELYVGEILCLGNIMLGKYHVWEILCWGNIMLGKYYVGEISCLGNIMLGK